MSLVSSNQPSYNLELQTPLVAPAQSNQTVNIYRKAADDDLSPTSEDSEPTMRIFSKAANPRDAKQHGIKDKKCAKGVKDEKGLPSFALVNKGTGEAMKHPSGHGKPIHMVPFKGESLDKSILSCFVNRLRARIRGGGSLFTN